MTRVRPHRDASGHRAGRRILGSAGLGLLLLAPVACGDGEDSAAPTTSASGGPQTTSSLAPSTTNATTSTTSPFGTTFAYQPLWPFRSLEEVTAWQREYRAGGQQAWHLDPGQTALNFASGYLGFREVDRTTSSSTSGDGVLIGVGYETEGGRTGTAAVVHLLRFGPGPDAPWEVVGTEDSFFSLTNPSYGARVTSPLTAGGRITGVDESIRVEVRQVSSAAPLGEFCCVPAGGEGSPWQATVTFRGASDGVLTVVASTGGHLLRVERFTVTAVRV